MTMKKAFLPLLLLIYLSIFSGCSKETDPDEEITYEDLIVKVEEAYTSLTSYKDTGRVTANYINDNPFTVIKKFKTVSSDNGLFRFEYKEAGRDINYYIIQRGIDMIVRTWWGITPGIEEEESLSMALGTAVGVSDMTSLLIPGLLLPSESGMGLNILRSLTNLALEPSENIGGIDCFVITGYDTNNDLNTIWIKKDNYLIKRLRNGHMYDDFDFDRIIDYYPVINVSIPDSEFLINVPD
jgi:outer membrane lipoprotein-sorting protein